MAARINVTHQNLTLTNSTLTFSPVTTNNNTAQERWLDSNGKLVATRFWNGTALVLNITG